MVDGHPMTICVSVLISNRASCFRQDFYKEFPMLHGQ